ncbi:allophanate hydrolase subunit 1 [Micromonospora sp. DR5-3]|uniref:5-oxoprolinase subunit B family protein n=1 Tax=unclassified Micromonospora TaxID=2617518 RepID=UPI0011D68F33|nr:MULTISPECIES: allophanate hydrolase subunit 1 [unclassified Micromonospora]MCW3815861.1 allophanate hydrolase subunit 1 [Micromonospora sp. DR5-3]TYC24375.1 allophanate hydrolase subunit 1 [Micromonospora sp. MP36]
MSLRVLPYGERALLIEVADHHEALALYDDIRREPPAGMVDLVSAAASVLVVLDDEESAAAAAPTLRSRSIPPVDRGVGALVEVPARYDGADLDEVAATLGMSVEEVVRRHETTEYVVAFVGFAPGFAYLTGLDPALHMPRRDVPRTRVPTGSIAIAGEYTAVYPRESPGGWRLLGHTTLEMWDLDREPPALLQPGMRVRFRRVTP